MGAFALWPETQIGNEHKGSPRGEAGCAVSPGAPPVHMGTPGTLQFSGFSARGGLAEGHPNEDLPRHCGLCRTQEGAQQERCPPNPPANSCRGPGAPKEGGFPTFKACQTY